MAIQFATRPKPMFELYMCFYVWTYDPNIETHPHRQLFGLDSDESQATSSIFKNKQKMNYMILRTVHTTHTTQTCNAIFIRLAAFANETPSPPPPTNRFVCALWCLRRLGLHFSSTSSGNHNMVRIGIPTQSQMLTRKRIRKHQTHADDHRTTERE